MVKGNGITHKHGEKKRKHWKKLHIGVDDEGHILASCVTDGHEQDPSQVSDLLSQIDPAAVLSSPLSVVFIGIVRGLLD